MQRLTQAVTVPNQLVRLKELVGNPEDEDEILRFCLDSASDIICDIRNSDRVEDIYLTRQISIAIEIYNKRGAEGQITHNENGIARTYSQADISNSVIRKITPVIRTIGGKVRVIE